MPETTVQQGGDQPQTFCAWQKIREHGRARPEAGEAARGVTSGWSVATWRRTRSCCRKCSQRKSGRRSEAAARPVPVASRSGWREALFGVPRLGRSICR